MKKFKNNLLVAIALMLGTLTNYANVEKISKNIRVVFENVEKNHALTIKDQEGVVLYNENIHENGMLVKFFDFSTLNDGIYTIEVEKEHEIIIKEVDIKDNVVTLNKAAEKVLYRPSIEIKEDRVFVSRINTDKSPLHVTVYYKDHEIAEETVASEKEVVTKVYHLDEALRGNYSIVVSSKETSYSKEFSF